MQPLRLIDRSVLTADINLLRFEKPRGFSWIPGQHVVVVADHAHPDLGGTGRALSIASTPTEHEVWFATHIPARGSSFKQALRALRAGDEVYVTPPAGEFTSERVGSEPLILLAAGVGIGAVRGILHGAEDTSLTGTLYYMSAPGTHVFREDLDAFAQRHPGFTVQYLDDVSIAEKGGVKEVEQRGNSQYFFSGVYARATVSSEDISDFSHELAETHRAAADELSHLVSLVR